MSKKKKTDKLYGKKTTFFLEETIIYSLKIFFTLVSHKILILLIKKKTLVIDCR